MKTFRNLLSMIAALFLFSTMTFSQEVPKNYKEIRFPEIAGFQPAQTTKVEFPNGLTLYLMEDHELPFIVGFARVKVGSIYEPAEKLGLASITGTVMRTGGTDKFPGDRLDEELAKTAASVESGITEEMGNVSFRCLKEDFNKTFEIFADVLKNPSFPQAKIDLAKKEISTAISRRNDNPGAIAGREFAKLTWGPNSPWARTVEYEHLARIQREDLLNFHHNYFVPNNIRIGIVGDFDSAAMKAAMEAAFSQWEGKSLNFPKIIRDPLRPDKTSVFVVDKPEVNQSNIAIGQEGVRRDDPDYPALKTFSYILGSGGFSSRLVQVVRSKLGLSYSVSGGFEGPYSRRGLFRSSCGTKSQSTAKAIEAIFNECKKILQERPSEEELENAKERLLNTEVFQFDTREKVLRRQMDLDYYGYPSDFLEKENAKIRSLTLEEVWQAAKRHLDPNRLTVLVVGNAKDFENELAAFGEIQKIDISLPEPAKGTNTDITAESSAKGQTLLSSWIESSGGTNALQGIRSFEWKGETIRMDANNNPYTVPVEMTVALPDRIKIKSKMFDAEFIQVMDANGGWTKSPEGVRDMPAAMAKEARSKQLDRDYISLLTRAARGEFHAQFIKSETVDGIVCDTIQIRDDKGMTASLSLDQNRHLLVRQSFREENEDMEIHLDDYRNVMNIQVPHHGKRMIGGKFDKELTLTQCAFNVNVDEASFKKPAN